MYIEEKLGEVTIVGISVRTSNFDGKAQKDIGELWNKFLNENIAATISNKASDDIYCIYTDYESDFKGEYTTIIGCKVHSVESITSELTVKNIVAGKYYKFTSEPVMDIWNRIWQSDYDRKYATDFDVYKKDGSHIITETFLSVNN